METGNSSSIRLGYLIKLSKLNTIEHIIGSFLATQFYLLNIEYFIQRSHIQVAEML